MSGIKVTNERPARPIPATESVEGEVSGDNEDWEPAGGGASELDQWKQPVRAATTANLTIATALNAGDTLDGVTLAAGDRVLVKDQSSALQNGIYIAGTTPARSDDMDSDDEVLGAVVYVIAGAANAGTAWAVTSTAATIVDTDAIDWAAFGGGGSTADFELNIEGGQSTIKAHGSMGSTETFDPTDGNVHTGTLNANCTLTLNPPVGSGFASLEFWLTEDGTGGWAVTWPGSVTEVGTHDTTAGTTQRVIVESADGGTSWIATWIGNSGSALTVKDEGTPLATAATSLDFVGAGVVASGTGAAKTITIPGGAGALDDLSDVVISSPAAGDRLRYNGSSWVNANLHDEPMIASDGSVMTDGLLNPMMQEVAW